MQHDSRNISMLMDFYEMTMAHGYFTQHENTDRVAFDVFFRRIQIRVALPFLVVLNKSLSTF